MCVQTDTPPLTSAPTRGHAHNPRTRSRPTTAVTRPPACDATCFRDRRKDNSFFLSFLQRKVLLTFAAHENTFFSWLNCKKYDCFRSSLFLIGNGVNKAFVVILNE